MDCEIHRITRSNADLFGRSVKAIEILLVANRYKSFARKFHLAPPGHVVSKTSFIRRQSRGIPASKSATHQVIDRIANLQKYLLRGQER
jgi:hypothetical protein